MIIKPMRDAVYIMLAVIFLSMVITTAILVIEFSPLFREILPVVIVYVSTFLNLWIAYGRTFTFSAEGCYVKWLCFSKMYTWDSFKTKRYENYNRFSDLMERNLSYRYGAVFSPHKVRKSILFKAATRGVLTLFAFSHIYVYFYPNDEHEPSKKEFPVYYTVNESEFRQKMAEWGVILEE